MRYNDQTLDPAQDLENIPNLSDIEDSMDEKKTVKAHVIRRNVEDYLERKALERNLKEVFEDDYLLD